MQLRNFTRLCFFLAGAHFVSMSSSLGQAPQPATISDDVRFLIRQSETKYESVRDVSYHFQIHFQDAYSLEAAVGTAKQSGSLNCETVDELETSDQPKERDLHITAYLGVDSYAMWMHNANIPARFLFQSAETMSDRARMHIEAAQFPHPEKFGFGNGKMFLWQVLGRLSNLPSIWKVQEIIQGGKSLLTLSWYQQKPDGHFPDRPSEKYFLDPSKGYGVVAFEARFMDGDLLRREDTVFQEGGGQNLWYPVTINDRYFASHPPVPDDDHIRPTWTRKLEISNLVVNPIFDQKDFTINALGLNEGQKVVQIDAQGQKSELVWSPKGLVGSV